MGLWTRAAQKNRAKPGFLTAFPFTSPCPSRMIDIDWRRPPETARRF
jgi:hypothetical protein